MDRIKWAVRKILLGNQVQTKVHKMHRFGNDYGGFEVAVDILQKTDKPIVYSFGIGEDLSFSQDILNYYKTANIYAFDPTPKSIAYVQKHPLNNDERFHFFPTGIAVEDGTMPFYLPENTNYVSGSVEPHEGLRQESIDVKVRTLKSLMEEIGHNYIDVLKMDIEGSEFNVIPNIMDSLKGDIGQVCVEVHERFFKDGPQKWKALKECMNEMGFYIAAVSKSKQEFTFVKM